MKASINANGSENQDINFSCFALIFVANKSISNGPKASNMFEKTSGISSHSVSSKMYQDSASAITLSDDLMYEAIRKTFLLSHHCQILFVSVDRFGYRTDPLLFT